MNRFLILAHVIISYHIAHTPHRGNVKCPCLAAKARADARLTLNEQAEKLEKLVEGK